MPKFLCQEKLFFLKFTLDFYWQVSFVLILVLLFSLVSCGKENEESGMKYCWNCGEMISVYAKFCERCGSDLSQSGGTKTHNTTNDHTFEDSVNDKQSSSITSTIPSLYTPNNTQDDNKYKTTCLSVGCDNIPDNLNFYCSEHACADSGCTRERSYSGNYCSWHECNEVGCENRKKDYGSYCSEHKCAKSWCNSAKSPLSDYCYIHDDD